MAGAVACEDEKQKAHPDQKPDQESDPSQVGKESQGAINDKNTPSRDNRLQNILRDALQQTGRSQFPVDSDWNRDNRHVFLAGLDDGLQGVGVVAEDIQLHRRISAHGPEAAGRIRDVGAAYQPDKPAPPPLQQFLEWREMFDIVNRSSPDDNLRLALEDRLDEPGDVFGAVLVVGVGIYNDVGSLTKAGLESGNERTCEPLVARQ